MRRLLILVAGILLALPASAVSWRQSSIGVGQRAEAKMVPGDTAASGPLQVNAGKVAVVFYANIKGVDGPAAVSLRSCASLDTVASKCTDRALSSGVLINVDTAAEPVLYLIGVTAPAAAEEGLILVFAQEAFAASGGSGITATADLAGLAATLGPTDDGTLASWTNADTVTDCDGSVDAGGGETSVCVWNGVDFVSVSQGTVGSATFLDSGEVAGADDIVFDGGPDRWFHDTNGSASHDAGESRLGLDSYVRLIDYCADPIPDALTGMNACTRAELLAAIDAACDSSPGANYSTCGTLELPNGMTIPIDVPVMVGNPANSGAIHGLDLENVQGLRLVGGGHGTGDNTANGPPGTKLCWSGDDHGGPIVHFANVVAGGISDITFAAVCPGTSQGDGTGADVGLVIAPVGASRTIDNQFTRLGFSGFRDATGIDVGAEAVNGFDFVDRVGDRDQFVSNAGHNFLELGFYAGGTFTLASSEDHGSGAGANDGTYTIRAITTTTTANDTLEIADGEFTDYGADDNTVTVQDAWFGVAVSLGPRLILDLTVEPGNAIGRQSELNKFYDVKISHSETCFYFENQQTQDTLLEGINCLHGSNSIDPTHPGFDLIKGHLIWRDGNIINGFAGDTSNLFRVAGTFKRFDVLGGSYEGSPGNGTVLFNFPTGFRTQRTSIQGFNFQIIDPTGTPISIIDFNQNGPLIWERNYIQDNENAAVTYQFDVAEQSNASLFYSDNLLTDNNGGPATFTATIEAGVQVIAPLNDGTDLCNDDGSGGGTALDGTCHADEIIPREVDVGTLAGTNAWTGSNDFSGTATQTDDPPSQELIPPLGGDLSQSCTPYSLAIENDPSDEPDSAKIFVCKSDGFGYIQQAALDNDADPVVLINPSKSIRFGAGTLPATSGGAPTLGAAGAADKVQLMAKCNADQSDAPEFVQFLDSNNVSLLSVNCSNGNVTLSEGGELVIPANDVDGQTMFIWEDKDNPGPHRFGFHVDTAVNLSQDFIHEVNASGKVNGASFIQDETITTTQIDDGTIAAADLNPAISIVTTGSVTAAMARASSTGGALAVNTLTLATAAATYNIPDSCDEATGNWVGVLVQDDSETVVVDVTDATDTIQYKGLGQVPGESISSPGAAQDMVVAICMATGVWYVTTNSGDWTGE